MTTYLILTNFSFNIFKELHKNRKMFFKVAPHVDVLNDSARNPKRFPNITEHLRKLVMLAFKYFHISTFEKGK